jgi:predicted alpha/beta hydrolase family esterase
MVLRPLPFQSMVLAARNDPYVAFDRAESFARAWGSTLVDMGGLGHMGNAAALGLWPVGLFHLGVFVGRLGEAKAVQGNT